MRHHAGESETNGKNDSEADVKLPEGRHLAAQKKPEHQRDATGKAPEKPAAQLATDKEIERFPFGADADADVQIVPVEKMFE